MKIKLELELPEAEILVKALKVIDPATIFCGKLLETIVNTANATIKEKESK